MPFDGTDYRSGDKGHEPPVDLPLWQEWREFAWMLGAFFLAFVVGNYVAWIAAGMAPTPPIPSPSILAEAPPVLEVLGFLVPFFGIFGAFIWWRARLLAKHLA